MLRDLQAADQIIAPPEVEFLRQIDGGEILRGDQ